MENMFFDNWEGLIRATVVTILAYIAIVFFLRGFGKRVLAKMKAFDFVITVALGSSLATVSLNSNIPLAEGVLVFLLLILLQVTITWISVRIKKVRNIVTDTPALLFYKGEMLTDTMKKERVAREDLFEKIRKKGYSGLNEVDAVILETTGDISIISKIKESDTIALENVKHFPE